MSRATDYTNAAQQRILHLQLALFGDVVHGYPPSKLAELLRVPASAITRDLDNLRTIAPNEIETNLHQRIPFIAEMKNVPYNQQLQVLFAIGDALPRKCGMVIDSRGNGSYVGEAAHDKYGSVVQRLMPTEGWYRDNMPPYKAALEDGTILVPKHDGLLQGHRAIRLIRGVPRMPESTDKEIGHGDSTMACIYSHAAARMDWGPTHAASRPRRSRLDVSMEGYYE